MPAPSRSPRARRAAAALTAAALVHAGAYVLLTRLAVRPVRDAGEGRITFTLHAPAPPTPTVRPRPPRALRPPPPPPRVDEEPPPPPVVVDDEPAFTPTLPPHLALAPNAGLAAPPPFLVEPIAVGGRTPLERAVLGYDAAPSGDAIIEALVAAPPDDDAPPTTSPDRVAARVAAIATVEGEQPRGALGDTAFYPSGQGGYVRRDTVTGERPPKTPVAQADVLRTMGHDGVFRDQERPLFTAEVRDDLVPSPDGGFLYAPVGGGWAARIRPDGNVEFDENLLSFSFNEAPPAYQRLGLPAQDFTSGTFSATDAIYRLSGIDPYSAAKTCFLDDTAAIRDDLRTTWRARTMAEATAALRAHLDELWSDVTYTAAERREALFTLWDECVDEETGEAARTIIIGFIRARLPVGSVDGYGAAELDALNARRTSAPRFDPYVDAS